MIPWSSLGGMLVLAGLILLGASVARQSALRHPESIVGKAMDLLDKTLTIERFVYRHHRAFGAALLAGGIALGEASARFILPLAGKWKVGLGLGVFGGQLLVFVLGALMLVRPSALKPLERLANRTVSIDTNHYRWIAAAGIALAGVGLGLWLRRHGH